MPGRPKAPKNRRHGHARSARDARAAVAAWNAAHPRGTPVEVLAPGAGPEVGRTAGPAVFRVDVALVPVGPLPGRAAPEGLYPLPLVRPLPPAEVAP
jgi:hypothetical protein